ncbi:hypothetical protein IAG44_08355 [Streptomyces roseirectus]|uniref:Uncharacterized protein n=1 Tax=Streptomyces roseirectus TaxID=2768066 RepID=A0A7H0I9I4_9ACTN|nr:hypothetical protein [Streptomyces roseirectus]QNP69450.1 hypothetical protein IAG44_08355 [Streptomyces roseirectus]
MTDTPVYTVAPRSPWRELLGQRWSGRRDRALVLRTPDHRYRVLGAPHRKSTPVDELSRITEEPAPSLLGRYDAAFHVRLDEQLGTRRVTLPTMYGAESVDARVLWWVHDPARTVRSGTKEGWSAVRADLDRRLRALAGSGESDVSAASVMHQLAADSFMLDDVGLTYRLVDVYGAEGSGELSLGQPGQIPAHSWSVLPREEYDFCLRVLRDGPASLAALWLARRPEEVGRVLEWSVSHQKLLRPEGNWQEDMAGLLGTLTQQERQELSEMLRDRLLAVGRPVPGGVNGEARRPTW